MKRLVRAISALATAAPLSLFVIGVTEQSASAATCWASGCAGYDINHRTCTFSSSVSKTVYDAANKPIATVYNLYSVGCRSNWVEAQLTPAAAAAGDIITVDIHTVDRNNNVEYMVYPASNDNQGLLRESAGAPGVNSTLSVYSDMVDGTNMTDGWAGVYRPDFSDPNEPPTYLGGQDAYQ